MASAGPVEITYPGTALVVGGSRGIGRQTVLQLTALGTRCALAYVRNQEAAERTVREAAELGPEPALVQGDQGTDAAGLVERAAAALGRVQAIVTTAVPIVAGRMLDVTEEQHREVMAVQVWGLQELVRAARADLEAHHGSVVTVSSIGSERYASYYGAIGPAKAAVENTVRYLAAELGPRGARVNAVSPCLVDDESHHSDPNIPQGFDQVLAQVARRTPLRRLATSAEIASVIVALTSSAFQFVTGQTIRVDGGYSLLA